jgi:hypothetical protein
MKYWISCFIFIIILTNSVLTPVQAAIVINPSPTAVASERSAVYVRMNPGEQYTDSIIVRNNNNVAATTQLESHDVDGLLNIRDKKDSQLVGLWTSVNAERIALQANGANTIPFQINVPQNSPSKEYEGAITAIEAIDKDKGVRIINRAGTRLYILVGIDFTVDTTLKDLEIMSPQQEDFKTFQENNKSFNNKQTVFRFDAENKGNAFTLVKGAYTLKQAGGIVTKGEFNKIVPPETHLKDLAITVNQEYIPGTMELSTEYTVEPLNPQIPSQYTKQNTSGELVTSSNLSRDQYNQINGLLKAKDVGSIVKQNYWLPFVIGFIISSFASAVILYRRELIVFFRRGR